MSYNRRLQASQAKLTLGLSVLQQYDYGYGEFNTISGAVDTSKNNGQIGKITGTIGATTQWLQGFQYDELGRLKNVAEYQSGNMSSQTYSQGYTFDRYGNRFQSANSTLGLLAVSSSEINSATNCFINSGSTPTTYDAAGNITQDTKFRGMNYSYDANGRITFAELTNHNNQQTSVYDCAGQRVQTTANTVTRTMVYDIFGQDVADCTGTSGGTLERENIYRGEEAPAAKEFRASTSSNGRRQPRTVLSSFISGLFCLVFVFESHAVCLGHLFHFIAIVRVVEFGARVANDNGFGGGLPSLSRGGRLCTPSRDYLSR